AMALAILATQRFKFAAIVTHVGLLRLAGSEATPMMLTAIRPDRGPALAACRFHVLMMFRDKVSGSSIEKSIDIVRVFVVRKSHTT
ncbi:hypothetical protein, partial [Mesorhizobium sp. M2D.F.Ca.ET.178.01.1.1]|uniref:hypothetical protein n=1 Tax=Mesorhizobium sp. M2D.F.Ca.ET.178.01.1.1 TaxID=2563937 RepID=UPI001AED9F8C